jgi:hypothetical protein
MTFGNQHVWLGNGRAQILKLLGVNFFQQIGRSMLTHKFSLLTENYERRKFQAQKLKANIIFLIKT